MLPVISEKSKKGFETACKKLGLSTALPDVSMLRPDLGLYITAQYMLAVIVEAPKDGENHDITNHSVDKYEPYFYAKDGYVPGSSGGGFSYHGTGFVSRSSTRIGARLSSNSRKICKELAEDYLDLWEIIILFVS